MGVDFIETHMFFFSSGSANPGFTPHNPFNKARQLLNIEHVEAQASTGQ